MAAPRRFGGVALRLVLCLATAVIISATAYVCAWLSYGDYAHFRWHQSEADDRIITRACLFSQENIPQVEIVARPPRKAVQRLQPFLATTLPAAPMRARSGLPRPFQRHPGIESPRTDAKA